MSRPWQPHGTCVRILSYNCLAASLATDFDGIEDAALAWSERMPRLVAKICDALCRPLGLGDADELEPFVACLQEVDEACAPALLAELRARMNEHFSGVALDSVFARHGGTAQHGQLVVWHAGLVPVVPPKPRFFLRQDTTRASQRYVVASFPQFTLATAHFKAGRAHGDERYYQMRQLLDAVEQVDGRAHGPLWAARPLVVAGDLNDGAGSRALNEAAQRGLSRAWMDGAGYAWTTWKKRVETSGQRSSQGLGAPGAPDKGEKKAIEDHVLVRNIVVVAATAPPSDACGRLPNFNEPSDHALLAARVVF